jgi:hypothetical protein
MDYEIFSNQKCVFRQLALQRFQAQCAVGTARDTEGLILSVPAVQAEITVVHYIGNIFRIDRTVRACM